MKRGSEKNSDSLSQRALNSAVSLSKEGGSRGKGSGVKNVALELAVDELIVRTLFSTAGVLKRALGRYIEVKKGGRSPLGEWSMVRLEKYVSAT